MAGSQKSEDKKSAKKVVENSKKEKNNKKTKEAKEKSPRFSTAITVINRGVVPKGTTFSSDEVKTLSLPPNKKSEKGLKPTSAKVFSSKIEFKEKVLSGHRNKKVLNYKLIKLLQQLTSDSRMVFVYYENEKNGHFFVLGLSETKYSVAFMDTVKKANPTTEVRWADEVSNGHGGRRDSSPTLRSIMTADESESPFLRGSSPDKKYKSRSKTVDSYIFNGSDSSNDGDDDESMYPRETSSEFGGQYDKVLIPSYRRRRADSDETIPLDHGSRSFSNKVVTRYIYTGPSDEEDSIAESTLEEKHKYKKPGRHSHQLYSLEDDSSVSMTPTTSDLSDGDYYSNSGFGVLKVNTSKVPTYRRASPSQRSPRQPKSRELPLSEAESKKGGWHCDFAIVTPTKDGGAKVSPDGSVMLFVATRSNVRKGRNSSSDEDSTSDGDSDLSYSSNTTLTLEGDVRNQAINDLEVHYGDGHR